MLSFGGHFVYVLRAWITWVFAARLLVSAYHVLVLDLVSGREFLHIAARQLEVVNNTVVVETNELYPMVVPDIDGGP